MIVTSRTSQSHPWPWPGARWEGQERSPRARGRIGWDTGTSGGSRTHASWDSRESLFKGKSWQESKMEKYDSKKWKTLK